jgi:hypothetical protein
MNDIVKIKQRMKDDPVLGKMVLVSRQKEIFLDLDGDQLADVGLMDTAGDGRVDTLAVDLTGDNEFNLYFMDTRLNDLPDVVFYDEKSNGDLKLVGIGEGVQGTLQHAAARVYRALLSEAYDEKKIETALYELDDLIKDARIRLIHMAAE